MNFIFAQIEKKNTYQGETKQYFFMAGQTRNAPVT